jgi:NAD-dependent dihydropyrimidine dehydrogenase PreA subunit
MTSEGSVEEKGRKLDDIRKEAEEKACPVQRVLYFLDEFISGPMCSRCFPCSFGTAEGKVRVTKLAKHLENLSDEDIQALKQIGSNMIVGSLCKRGKDTGRFIIETLSSSEEDFNQHISGICPKKECISLLKYIINPELCIMCGKCSEACKYDAIVGETKKPYLAGYLPFEILQKKCVKCGACVDVCPTAAIEVVTTADDLQEVKT